MIVPLTAKFFSKIENTLTVTLPCITFELDLELPFTWVAFFFSALSFTIANVIFIYIAPKIIKENKNYVEFKNSGGTKEDYIILIDDPDMEKDITVSLINQQDTIDGGDKTFNEEEWFWKIYKNRDKDKKEGRYCSLFFYILGFSLIFIVALQNIFWVINYIS